MATGIFIMDHVTKYSNAKPRLRTKRSCSILILDASRTTIEHTVSTFLKDIYIIHDVFIKSFNRHHSYQYRYKHNSKGKVKSKWHLNLFLDPCSLSLSFSESMLCISGARSCSLGRLSSTS